MLTSSARPVVFNAALRAAAAALVLTLGLASCGPAAPTPAVFASKPYAEALAANASDGKVLIVKASASWCPPCQKMNRETFVDANVVKWINDHGQMIELDVDENQTVATELNVESIPTLMIYKSGKQIARHEGFLGADAFIAFADRSLAGAK